MKKRNIAYENATDNPERSRWVVEPIILIVLLITFLSADCHVDGRSKRLLPKI